MTEEIKERIEKTKARYAKANQNGELPEDIKICPFQSTPEKEVPCSSRCALYRANKQKGFECPISELTSMSWVMNGRPMKGGRK